MNKFLIILVFVLFGSCISLSIYKLFLVATHPVKYQEIIEEISQQVSISPEIISSVINVESSYNERATSSKNALGLMQIKLSTAQYMNDHYDLNLTIDNEYLYNPKNNIYIGSLYLKYLSNKFENTTSILSAYNAGETKVKSWLNDKTYSLDGKSLIDIPYKETKNYVSKIEKNIKYYKNIYV